MSKTDEYTLRRWKEAQDRYDACEALKKEEKRQAEIAELKKRVRNMTGENYHHIEMQRNRWLCPYCKKWQIITYETYKDGICQTHCNDCRRVMVYCGALEREVNKC